MVHVLRNPTIRKRIGASVVGGTAFAICLVAAVLVCLGPAAPSSAQVARRSAVHYRQHGNMPPGAIGRQQLQRGGPLRGYFQPVEIKAPPGTMISLAVDGRFQRPQEAPVTVGMLIGQVYRLRVTKIPVNEGLEAYPTVEVINRLYPPEGEKWRFPIPVELTREELQYALRGKYVTRVIYLEPPDGALPLLQNPKQQRYFEVAADQDPLKTADRLGRPMAILRMGSRMPDFEGADAAFLYGCPPLIPHPKSKQR